MTKDQIFGIVRTVAAAIGGYLAGKGVIDGETANALAGAVATIAVAVWSIASKPKAA
ncbi:Pam3-gp28 family putative phage holin [Devosia sp.]|uniref:Pam3-gp28 family putative phage holin n=1 Tax=Devosia sp. TaxID=1871048 RepID=UPI002FC89A54